MRQRPCRRLPALTVLFGWAAWSLIGLAPLVLLFLDLMPLGGGDTPVEGLGRRDLVLLGSSAALSFGVAFFCTAISLLMGSRLLGQAGANCGRLLWLPLFLVAIPPYVHANAWLQLGAFIDGRLSDAGLMPLSAPPWLAVVWIQSMAFLPLAISFTWAALSRVDTRLVDAARMHAPEWVCFWAIRLPQSLPNVVIGSGFVFLLSMMEFSVPSLFQVRVYAVEIFLRFSSGSNPASSLFSAIPLIALGMFLVFRGLGRRQAMPIESAPLSKADGRDAPFPAWFSGLQGVALLVVLVQAAVPLVGLTLGAGSLGLFIQAVQSVWDDILFSLAVAGGASLGALVIAVLLTTHLTRRPWIMLAVLPLLIPAPLLGVGLIGLWNNAATGSVYESSLMPVMASMARFAPIAILVMYFFRKGLSRDILDAARLACGPGLTPWLHILAPLYAPGLIASFFVVFALSLGELTATLLVVPAGSETLSMRIFNLLHYGASETVAALCLFVTLLCMVATVLFLGAMGRLLPGFVGSRGVR